MDIKNHVQMARVRVSERAHLELEEQCGANNPLEFHE